MFASILAAAALIVDYVELEHIHNQSTSNDSCTIAAWGSKLRWNKTPSTVQLMKVLGVDF